MAVLGESWMALLLRELFIGISRFDLLNSHLGVSRKVLTERLDRLGEQGLVYRRPYSARPARYDYVLTDEGSELCDVLLVMTAWGDRWATGPGRPPATLHHDTCGHTTSAVITCSDCGQQLRAKKVDVVPRRSAPTPALAPARSGTHPRSLTNKTGGQVRGD